MPLAQRQQFPFLVLLLPGARVHDLQKHLLELAGAKWDITARVVLAQARPGNGTMVLQG